MTDGLTLFGALLLGLITSGHCLLMCGGISAALAVATRCGARGRPPLGLLAGYQLGRVASYALAGAILAGTGATLLHVFDLDQLRLVLRWVTAALLALLAVRLLVRGRGYDVALGTRAWGGLSPLARRLLPVRHFPQAFVLGALWGWMPCGLAYSMLLIAASSMDSLRGAAIMLAFGLGTIPAVLAGAFGAQHMLGLLNRRGFRTTAATALLLLSVFTVSGPALAAASGMRVLHWLPFDCATR